MIRYGWYEYVWDARLPARAAGDAIKEAENEDEDEE